MGSPPSENGLGTPLTRNAVHIFVCLRYYIIFPTLSGGVFCSFKRKKKYIYYVSSSSSALETGQVNTGAPGLRSGTTSGARGESSLRHRPYRQSVSRSLRVRPSVRAAVRCGALRS